ncbi:MAG TPA: ketohexokinase [Gammaproteobacteria bacterium]|nr:ketohexokinase [Gammaproteobacteria bacterium]
MAQVLGVGVATVDIINTVAVYPSENGEVRALDQRILRGGNCTNTLVVLSLLGHRCTWAGTLGDDPDSRLVITDLSAHGVNLDPVCRVSRAKTPVSYITLSQATGSRTIVHYRQLPEFSAEDFARIDLAPFQWLHFEGRHVADTAAMLQRAAKLRTDAPISVEIEKPRPHVQRLFPRADVLFFSRHYAEACGFADGPAFLKAMEGLAPKAERVLAWGERGGYVALPGEAEPLHAPATPLSRVVDTLGAGDTFNAAYIDARLRDLAPAEALTRACLLAGRKCAQRGLEVADAGTGEGSMS